MNKKSKLPFIYRNNFRPVFEHEAAGAWGLTTGLTILSSVMQYGFNPISLAVLGYSGFKTAEYSYKAHKMLKMQTGIFTNKLLIKTSKEILEHKNRKDDDIYIGEGFEWGTEHAQQGYQLAEMSNGFAEMSLPLFAKKIYTSEKDVKMTVQLGGAPWIHALGENPKALFINVDNLAGHTFVVGTTGAGKTRFLQMVIGQLIQRNEPIIILDPKGDSDLMDECRRVLKRLNREDDFKLFHPSKPGESIRIDPMINFQKPSEIASRIANLMNAEGAAESFKQFAWGVLNVVASGILYCNRKPSIALIKYYLVSKMDALLLEAFGIFYEKKYGVQWRQKVITNKRLEPVIVMMEYYSKNFDIDNGDPVIASLITQVEHDKSHYGKMIATLLPLLEQLTAGDVGVLLSPDYTDANDRREIINISNSIDSNHVLYLNLDSLSDSIVGSAIGSIILSESAAIAGMRYNYGRGTSEYVNLLVDETSEVLNEPMVQILNKGRGSGFRVIFCSQSVSDLERRLGSEAGARQVLALANNLIALRVNDKTTQEYSTESFPLVRIKSTMHSISNSSSSGDNPTEWGGGYGERLNDIEYALVSATLIGKLPNLQYFARLADGRTLKGKIPIMIE